MWRTTRRQASNTHVARPSWTPHQHVVGTGRRCSTCMASGADIMTTCAGLVIAPRPAAVPSAAAPITALPTMLCAARARVPPTHHNHVGLCLSRVRPDATLGYITGHRHAPTRVQISAVGTHLPPRLRSQPHRLTTTALSPTHTPPPHSPRRRQSTQKQHDEHGTN